MKVMKRFLSIVLVLALCLAFLPVQSAKAASGGTVEIETEKIELDIFEFDFTTLTDKQVEEIYFGTWYSGTYSGEFKQEITENAFTIYCNSFDDDELSFIEVDRLEWSYKGVVTVDNAILTDEEFDNEIGTGTSKAKALKFELDNSVFYVVPMLTENKYTDAYGIFLTVVECDAKTGDVLGYNDNVVSQRIIGYGEYGIDTKFFANVIAMVLDGQNIPRTFDDKAEDTTEDTTTDDVTADTTTEESKTDDAIADTSDEESTTEKTEKKVVKKTSDGREVYEGEQVYIVKKGDSLWKIAKKLLGNGARYTELFTRNNGIVKKAKLIFVGQEIIVPVK